MNPKKLFIPFLLLILTALITLTAAAQHRGVGYSGGGSLPRGGGYSGGRSFGGGYGGGGYRGGGYSGGYYGGGYHGYGGYGGGRYYGGYRGGYGGGRYYGGWGLGIGLGLGYYGGWGLGFGYPYGYGYGYPYSPYYPYAYPPGYAQPPVVIQRRNDDYYDETPAQDDDIPQDPYQDNTPPRRQKHTLPQDELIDDSRPVNPDSLTYKPGTNLTPSTPPPSNRNYSNRDKVWIKPHWKHTGDGWIWIDGYWK